MPVVLGAVGKTDEVVVLPLPNKFVVGAVDVADPKGLGLDRKAEVVNAPVDGLLDVVVDGVLEPPKNDGFGASVVEVELALLPNEKGRLATGAFVEVVGGGGANEDDPKGVLDEGVSLVENGLGALDEPKGFVVPLKSGKLGLDVGKLEAFVEGVDVDDGADFKLPNPANEEGGAGIEGILVFGFSPPLEDSSNSF